MVVDNYFYKNCDYNIHMTNVVEWVNDWTLGGKLSLLLFAVFVACIIFAALKLVKYSEVIMGKSKFGGAFVGGTMIAIVSSMPELITEVLQSLANAPAAGLSDDIGANAVTALAIGVALLVMVKHSFTKDISTYTKASIFVNGILGISLAVFIYVGKDISIGTSGTFIIGGIPILMLVIYIASVFVSYKYNTNSEEIDMEKIKNISLKKGLWMFGLFALILVIFAVLLNISVDSISDGYGISHASAGGIFLSMTTSLPEMVAFVALIRAKQFTAGILAIVGSQTFNLGISIFGDMAYNKGPIFEAADVHDVWGIAAIFGVEMILIGTHIAFEKKMKHLWMKAVLPTLVVSTYVVGWILMLTL